MDDPPIPPAEVPVRLTASLAASYRVRHQLGRGGMATVFLADDLKHGRHVAIKVLEPEFARYIGPERFRREIELLASFSHPNILPLHDSGDADGLLYYVMPYIEGESLRERLRREGPLPLPVALQITSEIADALSYAHDRGVVHRDIKPGNILLSEGHAVLADFGISQSRARHSRDNITDVGVTVGTPEYMSPEQAEGGVVDARSDIYSLGCVLFEMLSGVPRFPGAPAGQARAPSLAALRPGLPRELHRLLGQALARNPSSRFASAVQFRQAVERIAQGTVPIPWYRWALPAGLAAAGILAAWWVLWPGPPTPAPGAVVSPDPTHIAVLYFEDRSADSSLHAIADGLTEDLIDQLNQARALHVISALGVGPFRRTSVSLDSIRRSLGVGTVITGSVARIGPLLRVSVQMVDAVTRRQLFGQVLERPPQDLLSLRDQITDSLAWSLRTRLGQEIRLNEGHRGTRNVQAWELVQQANELRRDARALGPTGRVRDAIELLWQADSLLARAHTLDPRWTDPLVGRAWADFDQWQMAGDSQSVPGHPSRIGLQWIDHGIRQVQAALALRPGEPEALLIRGVLRWQPYLVELGRADSQPLAEADLRAAVGAKPSLALGWYWLSILLNDGGRFEEARQAAAHAYDADPFLEEGDRIVSGLFFSALEDERYAEARRWCDVGVARYAQRQDLMDCQLRILAWSGDDLAAAQEAKRSLERVEQADSLNRYDVFWAERRILYAAILGKAGRGDSARAVLNSTLGDPHLSAEDRTFLRGVEAFARLGIGDRREALRLLSAVLADNPSSRVWVARSAWYRPLHGDQAFEALVAPGASSH